MSSEARDAMSKAANRLHHLSMRYAGAMQELVQGSPVGMIRTGHPGLREARDFIDLILYTRAEINALTQLLLDAGVLQEEKVLKQFAEGYERFAQTKAKWLGVGLSDQGLVFKIGGDQ